MIQNINLSTYPFQIPELIEDILERPVTGEDYIFTNAPPYNRRERKFGERPDSDVEESPTRNENRRRQPSLPTLLDDISRNSQDKLYLFFKRAIDLICSLVGILLLSPVMLVIAVLIKLTSTGPVLFRQERYGYRGKTFTFLKFRSMRVESNSTIHMDYVKKLIQGEVDEINNGTSDEPLYKITNDPRITPLGRFLRKSSLDELPQLFNVLLGDMSMVGPRPPIPYETRYYKSWHLRRILEVKPGITGIWQVAGRSKTTFDEMVRMDFQYMKNRSLLLDIKLILMTFRAVFDSEGAM